MTATELGPYDHRGAYQGSELFDTSGTPADFCTDCEHAPCVAGGMTFCNQNPRFISVQALVAKIEHLADAYVSTCYPLWRAFRTAISRVEYTAWMAGFDGDRAIWTLATMHEHLRQAEDAS